MFATDRYVLDHNIPFEGDEVVCVVIRLCDRYMTAMFSKCLLATGCPHLYGMRSFMAH